MPESFVEPAALLNVDLSLRSSRTPLGTMPTVPPAQLGGSPPHVAVPLIPGRQRIAWMLVLAGWTLVGLGYFWSQIYPAPIGRAPPVSGERLLVFSVGTAWIWAALTPVVLWLTRDASFSPRQRTRSIGIYALAGAGFFLASGALEWALGVATGVYSAGQLRAALFSECVETRLLAFLAIVTLGWSARYFALYRTRQLHASELEARLVKTHLQVLKTQLQPHFLFNTLNTIAELVHTDPQAADQMITRLGRLLRLSLDQAGHQVVPLKQEIDFLRVYIEIEQVRFQERLQVVWDLSAETLEAAVPTLLWQPVLENAIRHGVTPLGGRGRIVITSTREGDDLVLEIRDNGRGLPPDGVSREGVGLRNVRERLRQIYGTQAQFALEPAPEGGTIATLRLPYLPCEGPQTPVPITKTDLQETIG
jgi:two-component system, LytTR family, sensor kinase